MPSSKRSRKHFKWGSHASAQRDLVAGTPRPPEKQYVGEAARQRNREARAALAAELARLASAARRTRRDEFRRRLRAICTSESKYRGFWSLRFAPLLDPGAAAGAAAVKSGPRPKRPAPRQPAAEPRARVAIMALVAERPGVLTEKTCAMVLAGSTSPTLAAAGLDGARLFGRLREVSAKRLVGQVRLAVADGRVRRTPQGFLVPGDRTISDLARRAAAG